MENKKNKLLAQIDKEIEALSKLKRIVKGTLNKVCSKNAKGEKREIFQLTYKAENNITKTVYIKKNKIEETEICIANYQQSRDILNNIILLNIELLKLKDQHGITGLQPSLLS